MKIANIIVVCFSTLTIACGVDVTDPQAGYFDDHTDKSGSQTYNNYGGSVTVINNQGSSYTVTSASNNAESNSYAGTPETSAMSHKSSFPTDLAYVGISKDSHGAKLVMKNNTPYSMSVKVNYTISCSVNGTPAETTTKTLSFSFDMYEQIEYSVDGIWHGGMTTIDCAGAILSIIPNSYDKSNFQAWTGNYPISL